MEENIIKMLGINILEHDGYTDPFDDCIQYHAIRWYLDDMEKYADKYAVIYYDGGLKIYEEDGTLLFDGSLLDSISFKEKMKERVN